MNKNKYLSYILYIYKNKRKEKAKSDFKVFCQIICKELFPIINLEEKWIKVLFQEIEQLQKTQLNFILNAPPRLGKTLFMSILYPCWLIGTNPKLKILITSASEQMRADTNARLKIILESNIYKDIFNDFIFTSLGAEIKQTNKLGNITLISSGTNLTGAGYNIIITDDFFNPTEISTQHHITRQIFLENALGRKEHSPKTRLIVLEQRISKNDTTATLLSKWNKNEYKHLVFKYQFNEIIKYNNIEYQKDEFLSPRWNEETKNLTIRERSNAIYETQYQQNPIDEESIIIKREWWNFYSQNYDMLDLLYTFFTCDIAHTDKKTSDYSVICCWGIGRDKKLYLIDMIKTKKLYVELKTIILNFVNKYKSFQVLNRNIINYKCIYIEGISNSKPLIDDIKNMNIVVKEIPRKEKKYTRLSVASPEIEQGKVFLPNQKEISKLLIEECYNFRKDDTHKHDDIVDNVIDAIMQELKINNTFRAINIDY